MEACGVITDTNALPAICGRVLCPQESQCEGNAFAAKREPVIGRLERFCADYAMRHPEEKEDIATPKRTAKIAVTAPAQGGGLTVAGDLIKKVVKLLCLKRSMMPAACLRRYPEFNVSPKN